LAVDFGPRSERARVVFPTCRGHLMKTTLPDARIRSCPFFRQMRFLIHDRDNCRHIIPEPEPERRLHRFRHRHAP